MAHMRFGGVLLIAFAVVGIGVLLAAGWFIPWILAALVFAVMGGVMLIALGASRPSTRTTDRP